MEGNNKTMNKTKEEFNNGDIIVCWAKGGAYGDLLTVLERHIGGTLFTALKCNKSGTVFITNCMDDYEHYNPSPTKSNQWRWRRMR